MPVGTEDASGIWQAGWAGSSWTFHAMGRPLPVAPWYRGENR
ncbi:hypothetical protein [Komagataeibacter saccharivorans]